MDIQAVIFDLDGTLLYTLPGIAAALNHALSLHGCALHSEEAVRAFVGNGARNLVARALPEGAQHPEYEAIYADYRRLYPLHREEGTALYPGVEELLAALEARGVKMAVVSNKDESDVVPMVERYFASRIPIAVGRRHGVPIKPAPHGALRAAARLHCAAQECLFVGDSDVDAQTAKNAQMPCVLVDWGYQAREKLESCGVPVVSAPAQLLGYMGKE